MSEPASRQVDLYICGEHAGLPGVVAEPSKQHVYTAGRLAARYTDHCQCIMGHTSLIAEGAAQVLIGGLPAARRWVKTRDGGQVLSGEPTVLIGGDLFSLPPGIQIEGDAAFQAKVLADLYKIGSTESGQMLFASMSATGRTWTICPGPKPGLARSSTDTDPQLDERQAPLGPTSNDPASTDGRGTDARTYYDPANGDSTLFHEGVHADDMMNGTTDENPCDNPGGYPDPCPGGERRAVGVPPYDDPNQYPYSQNTYNKERGYPPLPTYGRGIPAESGP